MPRRVTVRLLGGGLDGHEERVPPDATELYLAPLAAIAGVAALHYVCAGSGRMVFESYATQAEVDAAQASTEEYRKKQRQRRGE